MRSVTGFLKTTLLKLTFASERCRSSDPFVARHGLGKGRAWSNPAFPRGRAQTVTPQPIPRAALAKYCLDTGMLQTCGLSNFWPHRLRLRLFAICRTNTFSMRLGCVS